MTRRQRLKLTAAGALLTLAWLGAGTLWFVHWQRSEDPALSVGAAWPAALEAALLVALVFWVVAGIAHGIVRWVVTGRGPQA
jgi:hypothetical protein